jgi:hypothetical protein
MSDFGITNWMVKFRMFLIGLVFVGAINMGTSVFGYNIVDIISSKLNNITGKNLNLNKVVYIVIALSAIILSSKKSTWLPFLGWTAFPGSLIPNKSNEGNTTVEVNVKPNTRVAYWASQPYSSENINTPAVLTAYGDFSNSGVVMSDDKGLAQLTLQRGTDYYVPSGKTIKRHVHYRTLDHEYGMMGPVQTTYY